MFKHIVFFLLAVWLLGTPFVSAELYMWTDEKGIKHISNNIPADQVNYQKENERAFDPTIDNQEPITPEIKSKVPLPPVLKVDKPKKPKKISKKASSNGPVIVPPSDGSYWKCSNHAGKNFEELMNCAQKSFKSKKFNLSYDCSYCARKLNPDDIEAIVLNFKANYYSSHKSEDRARKFLIEIISRRIEEQPDDILVEFKKWVESGKEVDAFVINKP